MSINNGLFTSDKNYWETPQKLFNELDNKYHFTLDPCATHNNHKCNKYYTESENGLTKSWKNEIVFMNPPYGKNIKLWVEKAYQESRGGVLIVALLPARTDTKWFHDYIYNKNEIIFLKGRLKFELNGIKTNPAPFPSMIVIFKGETS